MKINITYTPEQHIIPVFTEDPDYSLEVYREVLQQAKEKNK